jgi:hypothetical protein
MGDTFEAAFFAQFPDVSAPLVVLGGGDAECSEVPTGPYTLYLEPYTLRPTLHTPNPKP